MAFADLHTHTAYSDGTDAPAALVRRAAKAGLAAVAITDHDTVDGIPEALLAGAETGIEIIPGIELTAERERREIHILGFFLDCGHARLRERLEELRLARVQRLHAMLAKLRELGAVLEAEDVLALAGPGTVGRLHLARAMVAKKIVGCTYEAFQRFIGDDGPAYVAGFRFSPADAIALIKGAGGIPVLAHPYVIHRDEWITELISAGIMGLEAYYPEHSQGMVNFYCDLAGSHGLLLTGGSDYHGEAKPQVHLGSTKVPYELVERLRTARAG